MANRHLIRQFARPPHAQSAGVVAPVPVPTQLKINALPNTKHWINQKTASQVKPHRSFPKRGLPTHKLKPGAL